MDWLSSVFELIDMRSFSNLWFWIALAVLGFYYGVEFAQAVFLLAFPMSLVGLLNISTARLIESEGGRGDLLRKRLTRCRLYTQMIGTFSIFVTSLWGMYQNLSIGVLG